MAGTGRPGREPHRAVQSGAQYNLGVILYGEGRFVEAYQWSALAARLSVTGPRRKLADANRQIISAQMSAQQIAAADLHVQQWKATRDPWRGANASYDDEAALPPLAAGPAPHARAPGAPEIKAEVAGSIAGSYTVVGFNPDGSRYVGTAKISDLGQGHFRFEWKTGGTYSGIGRRAGDIVSVDWGRPSPAVYRVEADGRLVGTWAEGRASETLSPLR